MIIKHLELQAKERTVQENKHQKVTDLKLEVHIYAEATKVVEVVPKAIKRNLRIYVHIKNYHVTIAKI